MLQLLRFAFRPWVYLSVIVVSIVVSRSAIILASHDDAQIDLSIYQEVGQLVLGGVDPYDFESKLSKRDALRADGHGVGEWARADKAGYDYYVSGNLPGSTALYALVEWASGGNAKLWRLFLALGDIALAGSAFLFLRTLNLLLDRSSDQKLFALAVVYYPSSIYWGVIRAEDKQFETALLFLTAALALARPNPRKLAACSLGAAFALGVSFKAIGVFLTPLVANHLWRGSRSNIALACVCAALVLISNFVLFDASFLRLMLARISSGTVSATVALHGSPWQLVGPTVFQVGRPLAVIAAIGLLVLGYARSRIDLLNLCSGCLLIAICLATVTGGMDRMNMAMIFAMFCLASISRNGWRKLVLINFCVQVPIYAAVIARASWVYVYDLETPDAVAALLFLVTYFWLVGSLVFHPASACRAAHSDGPCASASSPTE